MEMDTTTNPTVLVEFDLGSEDLERDLIEVPFNPKYDDIDFD